MARISSLGIETRSASLGSKIESLPPDNERVAQVSLSPGHSSEAQWRDRGCPKLAAAEGHNRPTLCHLDRSVA
jgi:hypothetical protein